MVEPDGSVEPAARITSALIELLLRYFGDGALPDYSAALTIVGREPFWPLREQLMRDNSFEDLTDVQYDLGWSWWLGYPVRNVRVSFVGPYAVVLDASGHVVSDNYIESVLTAEGFVVLGEAVLTSAVEIWAPEVQGTLYEFVFEFDRGLPWGS